LYDFRRGEKMQAQLTDLRVRLDDIDKRRQGYKEQVVRLKKVPTRRRAC